MGIKQYLKGFTTFQLVLIALTAALGIASKPVASSLAHIVTGPLFIPGGVVAGGIYMMWLILGAAIVGRRGTAVIISIVQAVLVVSIGLFGAHGIMSFVTYILPGLAVDMVFLFKRKPHSTAICFFAGIAANVAGSVAVNFVFFRLPLIPLILTLSAAALSGGIGGLIAGTLAKECTRLGITADRSMPDE